MLKIAVTFAERKIGVSGARPATKIVEIFLIFRNREVVEFASKETVGVVDLATIGPFGLRRRNL